MPTIPTHLWGKQILKPALLVPTLSLTLGRREGQAAALEPWELYPLCGRTKI